MSIGVGQRVVVWPRWNSFCGKSGEVKQTDPYVMVLLDGERLPMRFDRSELLEESMKRHVTAGEW